MEQHQLLVNLMLDEIHVEPCSSFKGGSIVGFALNEPTKKATTVQAFMISSILSKDKEVVALVPVVNLTAAFLHKLTVDILKLVHKARYKVISILSDNNRVNRNMFTMMSGVLKPYIAHPCDPVFKLFFCSNLFIYSNAYVTIGLTKLIHDRHLHSQTTITLLGLGEHLFIISSYFMT